MASPRSSIKHARISDHALEQMAARNISVEVVRSVLREPEAVIHSRSGRVVAQKIVRFGHSGSDYLVRVFVDVDRETPEVVTTYRTSKIRKYTDQL